MIQNCFIHFFFFNDTATTEIYTLSLHDALPICALFAEVGVPGATERARPVRGERVHRHLATDEVRVYALTDLGHGPGELVAHHQRRGAVAHLAQGALDLRPADADGLGADYHGPRLDGRLRDLLDRHLLRSVPHDGLQNETSSVRVPV